MPTAQFWCFGEGPLRGELEETARGLGIADRFKLFGFRRDVPDLMRADRRDVPAVAPRAVRPGVRRSGAGRKAGDRLQRRRHPEIIMHGETGLLVPPPAPRPTNVAALADAILTLLDNRDRAAAMGRRGRELALDRFTWPRYLEQLNALYERILDRERQPLPQGCIAASKRRNARRICRRPQGTYKFAAATESALV